MDYSESKKLFAAQLCVDFGLNETELNSDVVFAPSKPYGPRARNYLKGEKPFFAMTLYSGRLIVVADESIMPYAKKYVGECSEPFRAFDAPNIFALNAELAKHGYTIDHAAQGFLPRAAGAEIKHDIRVFVGEEIRRLYEFKGFDNALCYSGSKFACFQGQICDDDKRFNTPQQAAGVNTFYSLTDRRRDTVAVAFFDRGMPQAIAGCTNDADRLWQIGIDVTPEYRRRGLGSELVTALKSEVEKLGVCPFYCCAWSNVPSQRTAVKSGFAPEWAEVFASPVK